MYGLAVIYIFWLSREIHRMVEWLVSESMVTYYIHLFRDSTWPGGELAKPATLRTEAVRHNNKRHHNI